MYKIEAFGRSYWFNTLKEACDVANRYFEKSGNLVGIEWVSA